MSTPGRNSKGLPIGPRHVLYPMLALIALINLLFGSVGHTVTEDMPESETHPYYPDHFWPYPVLAMAVLVILGLLAVLGQSVLQPGAAADPRLTLIPRPEWYFLSLFQFAKLGPGLVTTIVIPAAVIATLIFWPLLDAQLGPKIARRLGWHSWPAPRRNVVTGTIWLATLWVIGLLTVWAALSPGLCIPWFHIGPVCGG
jgi:quinol-cytochrome oxidoreductase complex cytochrome b subunit